MSSVNRFSASSVFAVPHPQRDIERFRLADRAKVLGTVAVTVGFISKRSGLERGVVASDCADLFLREELGSNDLTRRR